LKEKSRKYIETQFLRVVAYLGRQVLASDDRGPVLGADELEAALGLLGPTLGVFHHVLVAANTLQILHRQVLLHTKQNP